MGSRTCFHFKSAKRFCLGENAKEKDDLNLNLVRHQIQAEDCLLGGSGEEANPQMASTRSGRIRFNLFAIILKIHRLKSQTKPLLTKYLFEEQYFPKIPNYNSWRPVFPRWRKSWMESHCAEKRTSKASTINFCIISFLKV